MRIGVLGRGQVGSKLKQLFEAAGHETVAVGRDDVRRAADHGEVVVLACPFAAATDILPPLADALAGKVVIDVTNPVAADWSPLLLGQENSAGEEIARALPSSSVVKAFNTVFADVMTSEKMRRHGGKVTCFVAGDDPDGRRMAVRLADEAGFAGLDVGPLRMSRHLEAMAHLNIAIALAGGGTDAAFLYDQRER